MADTAVVRTFGYRHEAEFARETLKAAGIESVLMGDDAGGAYAGMSFSRQIRLLVRTSDLDQARAILSEEDPGAGADGPEGAA
jgi:hypothetical protein